MADRVGFEPTVPLLVHLISSQGRYNHFDTCPNQFCGEPLRYYATTFRYMQVFFICFLCKLRKNILTVSFSRGMMHKLTVFRKALLQV